MCAHQLAGPAGVLSLPSFPKSKTILYQGGALGECSGALQRGRGTSRVYGYLLNKYIIIQGGTAIQNLKNLLSGQEQTSGWGQRSCQTSQVKGEMDGWMDTAPAPWPGGSPTPPKTPAECDGQLGGMARESKGLRRQEGWGHEVVPPASYFQLTPTILFKNSKAQYFFFLFFFIKARDRNSLRTFTFQLQGSQAMFSSPPHPV